MPNLEYLDEDYAEKPVPSRHFDTLKKLDRHRQICLGVPVVKHKKNLPPWGYYSKEGDDTHFWPDDKQLRLLLKVKALLRDYSYEEMAEWLTKAGYPISRPGLHLIMTTRQPFKEIMLPLEERMKL